MVNKKKVVDKPEETKVEKVLIKTKTNIRYQIKKIAIDIPGNALVRCSKEIAAEFVNDKLADYFDENQIKVIEI